MMHTAAVTLLVVAKINRRLCGDDQHDEQLAQPEVEDTSFGILMDDPDAPEINESTDGPPAGSS